MGVSTLPVGGQVYSEIYTKHTNALYEQNVEILSIKACGK